MPRFLSLALWLCLLTMGMRQDGAVHDVEPPSVLLITLDTTRRDFMGFHGRTPSPTPNLDRLAAQSVVFDDAYTVAPLTLPAHASLMTGLYPMSHGVRDNGLFRLADAATTLAEVLAEAGYRTSAHVAAVVLDASFGVQQGFARFDAPPRALGRGEFLAERRAEEMVDLALAELPRLEAPWFYWLHLFDPHFPYGEIDERRIADAEQGSMREWYADEIRHADAQLGRLLAFLDEHGPERLAVVFASDHGESLGDAYETTHGHFIYDPTMRIPLLMRHPDLAPARFDRPVSLVDVMPTLLALLGQARDDLAMDGVDLSPYLRGGAGVPPERSLALECYTLYFGYRWAPYEGVVRGPLKYVHSRRRELFDRRADPGESHDLYAEDERRGQAFTTLVEERFGAPPHALEREEAAVDPALRRRIAELGYVEGSLDAEVERPDFDALPDARERLGTLQGLERVTLLASLGRPAQGLPILRQLVADEPDSAVLHERLGMELCSLQPDNVEEAERHLRRAAELSPPSARIHYYLGLCAARQSRRHEQARQLEQAREQRRRAETEYELAHELEPTLPQPLLQLALMRHTIAEAARATGNEARFRSNLRRAIDWLEQFVALLAEGEEHSRWSERLEEWRAALGG